MTEPQAPSASAAQAADDLSGTTVGRFAIRVRLGAGGMGEVYRADDTKLKRTVALKRLAPRLRADEHYRHRFVKEAERASRLTDPHIAGLYDILEEKDELFLVMEHVEGETFRQRFARPLSLEEFLPLALQCAEALASAHEKGIVHRDIKPENIMLTPAGQVKVLDFGVARALPHYDPETVTQDTEAGAAALSGTPAYMAPEELLQRDSDHRADLFSLGVVFYEALTGRHPFRRGSFVATADSIIHDPAFPPRQLNPALPEELEKIILKLLDKNPQGRFASALELRQALAALTGAEPLPPRPRSFPRRALLVAALAVVALALVLAPSRTVRDAVERWFRGPVPGGIQSLAVLPLQNLSGDPAEDYFADGMTEALITELGRISSLRVISRTSVMRYKGSGKSPREIAGELKVDAVVEGSAQRAENRIRISVRIIEARTESLLWSRAYERDLSNVLILQSELARAIAQEFQLALTPQERGLLARNRPVKPDAHEAYLRGRYFWNQRTARGYQLAIEHFEKAIQIDPDYALAHAGLADVYSQRPGTGEDLQLAEVAALQALVLDPASAEARTSLAAVRFWTHDWIEADQEFRRALELNPSYATAHLWYSRHLTAMGRTVEGLEEVEQALVLDPFSVAANNALAWTYHHSRDFDSAIRHYRQVKEMAPSFLPAYAGLAEAYLQTGRMEEAVAEVEAAARLAQYDPQSLGALGYVYAVAGRRAEARRVLRKLNQLDALTRRRWGGSFYLALIHVGLEENEEALRWLEQAYEEEAWLLSFIAVNPALDPLRDAPRFQALQRRLHLPVSAASPAPPAQLQE